MATTQHHKGADGAHLRYGAGSACPLLLLNVGNTGHLQARGCPPFGGLQSTSPGGRLNLHDCLLMDRLVPLRKFFSIFPFEKKFLSHENHT